MKRLAFIPFAALVLTALTATAAFAEEPSVGDTLINLFSHVRRPGHVDGLWVRNAGSRSCSQQECG